MDQGFWCNWINRWLKPEIAIHCQNHWSITRMSDPAAQNQRNSYWEL